MKAVVTTKYGPPEVLELQEVEKPTPKDDEVLIRIYATTVTAGDCEMRSLKFPLAYQLVLRMGFGFRRPRNKIPGTELAGERSHDHKPATLDILISDRLPQGQR